MKNSINDNFHYLFFAHKLIKSKINKSGYIGLEMNFEYKVFW